MPDAPTTDPALEPETLSAILNASTPGKWFTEETDAAWMLFASIGGYTHPMQLIKAPKVSQEYAEYWPNTHDATLIRLAPELARRYLASLWPARPWQLYRVTLGAPWNITRLPDQDTLEHAQKQAVRDALAQLKQELKESGGMHFLDRLEESQCQDDPEMGWEALNANSQDFGLQYVIQATENSRT